jgi:hypothetical protein
MTATCRTRFDPGAFHRGMLGVDDDLAVVVSQRFPPARRRAGPCTTCTVGGCGRS